MKLILALMIASQVVGCAAYGKMMDAQDPCQSYGKSGNYQKPNWCGAAARDRQERVATQLSLEYLNKSKMAFQAGQYSTACSYARMHTSAVMSLNNQAHYEGALRLEKKICSMV